MQSVVGDVRVAPACCCEFTCSAFQVTPCCGASIHCHIRAIQFCKILELGMSHVRLPRSNRIYYNTVTSRQELRIQHEVRPLTGASFGTKHSGVGVSALYVHGRCQYDRSGAKWETAYFPTPLGSLYKPAFRPPQQRAEALKVGLDVAACRILRSGSLRLWPLPLPGQPPSPTWT